MVYVSCPVKDPVYDRKELDGCIFGQYRTTPKKIYGLQNGSVDTSHSQLRYGWTYTSSLDSGSHDQWIDATAIDAQFLSPACQE